MEHPLQHPPRDGVTRRAGTQRSEPPAAMGSGGPQGASWLDNRRSVVALLLGRRPVTPCAGRRLFIFRQSRRNGATAAGASSAAAPVGPCLRAAGAGIFFRGGVAQSVERRGRLGKVPEVAGSSPAPASTSRSACSRAAASPMAERQGDSRTGWTSHRPVASDLAVRRRVAHGIQPKSRAAGERSTASYTACASSARRDSLLPIFPKRPARGARRRGDGRGARILLQERYFR